MQNVFSDRIKWNLFQHVDIDGIYCSLHGVRKYGVIFPEVCAHSLGEKERKKQKKEKRLPKIPEVIITFPHLAM